MNDFNTGTYQFLRYLEAACRLNDVTPVALVL